jgi:tetratricopeptide (TPR) repeat protein
MGQVFSAVDGRSGKRVALKLLRAEKGNDTQRARFQREGRALARVHHPNLVAFYESGEIDGRLFLAMELVEGENLAELSRKQTFTPDEAVRLGLEVAGALGALHDAGVVHRDVKLANVVVDGDGRARLVDLGVARGEGLGETRLTRTGMLVGTPHSMAPEQLGARGALGPPADVYALGCLLYELVTGRPPFLGDTLIDLLREIANTPPTPPSQLAEIPPALDALILRMLAKEPSKRLADGASAVAALSRIGRPASRAGGLLTGALSFLLASGVGFALARARTPAPSPAPSPLAGPSVPATLSPLGSPLTSPSPRRPRVAAAEAALAVAEVGTATVEAKRVLAEALQARRASGEANREDELHLLRLYSEIGDLAALPLADALLAANLAPDVAAEVVARGGELVLSSDQTAWVERHAASIRGMGPKQEWARAVCALARDDLETALSHLDRAQELDRQSLSLRLLHASTQLGLGGRQGRAREALESLLVAEPHIKAGALLSLGFLRWQAGDTGGAIALMRRAERIHPDSGVEFMLGRALVTAGQTKTGLDTYLRAIELGRGTGPALRAAMRLLFLQERFQELLVIARRAAAATPASRVAARYEFLSELYTGNPLGALLALARAWERTEDPALRRAAAWEVAHAARDLGEWEHSGSALLAWVAERESGGELHALLRGWEAEARGDVPLAMSILDQAGSDALPCRLARVVLLLPRRGRETIPAMVALAQRAEEANDPLLLARLGEMDPRTENALALTDRALELAKRRPEFLVEATLSQVGVHLKANRRADAQTLADGALKLSDAAWWEQRNLVVWDCGHYYRCKAGLWLLRFPRDQRNRVRRSKQFRGTVRRMVALSPLDWGAVNQFLRIIPSRRDTVRFTQGLYLPMLGWRGRLCALAQLKLVRGELEAGSVRSSAQLLAAVRSFPFHRLRDRTLLGGALAELGLHSAARRILDDVLLEAPFCTPAKKGLARLGQ